MGVQIDGRYLVGLTMEMTHILSDTKLLTDPPKDNGGDAKSFSPTDLLATAATSCMMSIMALEARKLGLDLTGMKTRVDKIMSQDLPRRVKELVIDVWLPAHLSLDQRALLENKAGNCPVLLSLSAEINCCKTFHYLES